MRESHRGPFITTRLMWIELLLARELIWRLFVRDFSAKYRQSALGFLWALIMPLVTVGMFIGMNNAGILNIANVGIPYPLYAIIGLTIWSFFTVGLTASSQAITGAGSMVVKINFPKVALLFAATGQTIVDFFIRAVLIGLTFMHYGIAPNWIGLGLGLISIIPLYLFMTGIGFVLSLAAAVVRDVANFLNLGLMAFMLLTPVVYPIQGEGLLAKANLWNPLNYFVNVPRDFIVKGHTDYLIEFAYVSSLSLVVFYIGWRLFYLAQTKIAERI
ncbi:ABC transporter permease [bacterium]|nr:ABC transporter permease [bacterium]